MKNLKSTLLLVLTAGILWIGLSLGFSFDSQGELGNLMGKEVISLASHHNSPSLMYAATEDALFITDDEGMSWRQIYYNKEANKKINLVAVSYFPEDKVYLATQNGLYESQNEGSDWLKVFKGMTDLESDNIAVGITENRIYLGTKEGLFISRDNAKNWQKIGSQFMDSVISNIAIDPLSRTIYIGCQKGIFCSEDDGDSWRRIFVIYSSEIPDEDLGDYDSEISTAFSPIKCLHFSNTSKRLYIVVSTGIYYTDDKGVSYQRITQQGLPNLSINSIVESNNILVCATKNGVFKLGKHSWQKMKINSGDFSLTTNELLISVNNAMWIATDNGVCVMDVVQGSQQNQANDSRIEQEEVSIEYFDNLFNDEPTIEEVHKAAIDYAEANLNKIKRWRTQSKLKALLPSFSIGYDKVIYGSSSGAMAIGPRDWNFDMSWDLKDIVWSSDQTSIDSRSRLTVQLRQDILEQVTYYYFERKKLKYELHFNPPQNPKEQFLKELELERITAILDGFTDNLFLSRVE